MRQEKLLNVKKGKRELVFDILNKQGYILDKQTCEIFGESGLWKVGEHVRIWKKLKEDTSFFEGKKVLEKRKGYRCHLIRTDGMEEGKWYRVGKEYYNSIA